MAVTKALSDENRIRALMFLTDGELCVCQLIELLQLAPSTVSKHMAVLYQARLVESRKEARWIYYRLAEKGAPRCALDAIRWARKSLDTDPAMLKDAKHLKSVLRISKDELCARYKR